MYTKMNIYFYVSKHQTLIFKKFKLKLMKISKNIYNF